jgi:hypothetical protein
VLEERERIRGDRAIGMARGQFGHPAYQRAYSMKLDTSTITPEEGARIIREFVQTRATPNPVIPTDRRRRPLNSNVSGHTLRAFCV